MFNIMLMTNNPKSILLNAEFENKLSNIIGLNPFQLYLISLLPIRNCSDS